MLHISPESPASTEAGQLIAAHQADLIERYGHDRPSRSFGPPAGENWDDTILFLIAWFGDEAAGFARLASFPAAEPGVAEITHLFLKMRFRGRRIARELLRTLEAHAESLRVRRLLVATGERQPEAVALFAAAGFHRIPAFRTIVYEPASRFFEKRLEQAEDANIASAARGHPSS